MVAWITGLADATRGPNAVMYAAWFLSHLDHMI